MPAIYSILFIGVGLILLLIELKFVPGLGLLGIAAAGLIGYGGYIAIAEYDGFTAAIIIAGSAVAAAGSLLFFVRSRAAKRLVLNSAQDGQPSDLPAQEAGLVGEEGEALSDLRPAGIARVGSKRLDVIAADGEYIERGERIRVVRVHQNSIVVTRV